MRRGSRKVSAGAEKAETKRQAAEAVWCAAAAVTAVLGSMARAIDIPGGTTIQTFNTQPPATDWSTGGIAGAAGDITTDATMDTSVIPTAVSAFAAQLPS